MSGKTTYARQHAKPGDIIIDFDLIAQALGSPVGHGHDLAIAETAAAAWDAAIRRAVDWSRRGCRVWLVDSAPAGYRQELYTRAGARLVHLAASREELHRRASQDRPASWHARIDTFLDGKDPQPRTATRW